MTINVTNTDIDNIRNQIAALKARYQAELDPLIEQLSAAERGALIHDVDLALDEDDAGMKEHLDFLM